ncbi:hypothetical protein WKW50_16380 [Ochrobactrum sp. GPK 3]
MTDQLATELRRAVKNGLLHISLHRRWDGKVWCAGYRNTDNSNVQYIEDADHEKALLAALRAGIRDVKNHSPRLEPKAAVAAPKRRRTEDFI